MVAAVAHLRAPALARIARGGTALLTRRQLVTGTAAAES
jgi:hypothetical protein